MSNPKGGKEGWLQFFVWFERRHDKEQSLADYCRAKGVEYKTARNWASKLRGEGMYPAVNGRPDGDNIGTNAGTGTKAGTGAKTLKNQHVEPETEQEQGQGQGQQEAPEQQPGQGQGQGSGDSGGDGVDGGKSKPKANPKTKTSQADGAKRDMQKMLNSLANLKPYVPGEPRVEVTTHGAYTKYLPPDIQAEVNTYGRTELRDVIEEIRLTKGRLMLVQRNKAHWDAHVECGTLGDDHYPVEEIETQQTPDGSARKEKRKRPDFEYHEDRLARRLAWLMQVQEQLAKKASFSADEAIAMRRQIMEQGMAEGWTYAQIGMEIEKYGIELPFTLQALIRKELDLPVVDDGDAGITDEELDRLSEKYRKEAKGDSSWLRSRQKDVQEIHDAQDVRKTAS